MAKLVVVSNFQMVVQMQRDGIRKEVRKKEKDNEKRLEETYVEDKQRVNTKADILQSASISNEPREVDGHVDSQWMAREEEAIAYLYDNHVTGSHNHVAHAFGESYYACISGASHFLCTCNDRNMEVSYDHADRNAGEPSSTGSGSEIELTYEEEVGRLLNFSDLYSALVLARYENIDMSSLKCEYSKKAMLVHPDKNMRDEKAVEAFEKLQNAYEVLLDSLKRLKEELTLNVTQSAGVLNLEVFDKGDRFKSDGKTGNAHLNLQKDSVSRKAVCVRLYVAESSELELKLKWVEDQLPTTPVAS
ncbi:hypothetical protein C5167_004076 [Papaver somniferum]|nr:hypothetical protein C5167_004076 [Papaver somniferum]